MAVTTSQSDRASLSGERRPAGGGAAPIETARARLDEALLGLRQIADPAVAVRRVDAHLAEALRSCYVAIARRTDHHAYHAAIDAAAEATRGALGALQEAPTADPAAERTLGTVATALGTLMSANALPASLVADLPAEPQSVTGPVFLPATVGAPAVITLARAVLTPAIALPAPPPVPPPPAVEVEPPPPPPAADLAAVEALGAAAVAALEAFDNPPPEPAREPEPPPAIPVPEADAAALAVQVGPPLAESALTLLRARECLDELAGLGNMRRRSELEPWAAPRTEERLLARVDALVACGEGVFPALVKELEDRPVPDPELTWALTFLFGSLAGDDAVDQVIRLVLTADLDAPDMAVFVADALALAPSPALERPLRAWIEAGRPSALRAAALTALARRRRLTFVETITIAEQAAVGPARDARVLLAAARALAFSSGPIDAGGLDRLLRHPDAAVARAALVSALLQRCRLGLDRARALTEGGQAETGDALLFLALAGETDAWPLLEATARRKDAPPIAFDALGWFGSFRAVDLLLDVLARGPAAVHGAAAAALHRLTGAGLTDDEKDGVPAGGDPVLGGPFAPPPPVGELTTKPEIWSAFWDRHRPRADPNRRHRHGHLWTPEDDLWALEDEQTGAAERELLYVELVARTGADAPLDLEDFISRQRQRIADLRAHAGRSSARAGDWPTRLSR